MPRRNFISKDFFVQASVEQTKKAILGIPDFVKNISFTGENKLIQSWRFLYARSNGQDQHIDISLIPLNDGHTRITLHGTYANGHSFYKDRYVTNALHNFEAAVFASLKGSGEKFVAGEVKTGGAKKIFRYVMVTISSVGVFFFWKKLS